MVWLDFRVLKVINSRANFKYSDKKLANEDLRMMYSTKGIGMNLYGYTESAIKLARKVIENK